MQLKPSVRQIKLTRSAFCSKFLCEYLTINSKPMKIILLVTTVFALGFLYPTLINPQTPQGGLSCSISNSLSNSLFSPVFLSVSSFDI